MELFVFRSQEKGSKIKIERKEIKFDPKKRTEMKIENCGQVLYVLKLKRNTVQTQENKLMKDEGVKVAKMIH